jgi:hypothetical protein
MGQNLRQLLRVADLLLQHGTEPVMKPRSLRLRQRAVCGVADEEVPEAKLIAGAVATDQESLSAQRFQGFFNVAPTAKLLYLAQLESLSDHAGGLQHIPFVIRQPV